MDLIERPHGSILVVEPTAARLEADVSREFRRRLLACVERAGGDVVVDLGAVAFADSAALGALVAAFKRLAQAGRELALCRPQPSVRILVELTRLHRILGVHPTEAMAVDALSSREGAGRDAHLAAR